MADHILACEGILEEVLLRVPAYSLSRFRCVSKSWRDLIDSSHFGETRHLFESSNFAKRTHAHSDPGSSVIITMTGTNFFAFDTLVKNGRKGYKAIAEKLSSHDTMRSLTEYRNDPSVYLSGSCNGLICVSRHGDFVVWNPYIDCDLHSDDLASPPYDFRGGYTQDAFGYDHVNDDYKLVRWRVLDPYFCGIGEDLYELCVYSFKHNSWTTITDAGKLDLQTNSGYLPWECTFFNGAMHWVAGEDGSRYKTNLILAFDLGTYKFTKISCPPFPQGADYLKTSLSGLNGCLWLGYTYTCPTKGFSKSTGPRSVDIWVMREYGANQHY